MDWFLEVGFWFTASQVYVIVHCQVGSTCKGLGTWWIASTEILIQGLGSVCHTSADEAGMA